MNTDRIEKSIELKASLARVWRALTDHREFGAWFRVRLDAPFVVGRTSRGQITFPGFEHLTWEAVIQTMEPERHFSFLWHPFAIDAKVDYSAEPSTLVEFTLEAIADGTRLRVVESGFDKLPVARRREAFRANDGGWADQMKSVERYVGQNP